MAIVVTVLHICVCLFLIVVILLQAGRGQGLSFGTFGGTPSSILGTKTASFLTKLTTACAIIFLFTCIGLNILETQRSRSLLQTQQVSQVDFDQIKEALEEAQNLEGATEAESAVAGLFGEAAQTTESGAQDVEARASEPLQDVSGSAENLAQDFQGTLPVTQTPPTTEE